MANEKDQDTALKPLLPLIGEKGVQRIIEYRGYRDGWDKGRGRSLQSASLRMLVELAGYLPTLPVMPDVVLTHDGNISLVFTDLAGKSVELDLLPDGYYLYSEGLDNLEREFDKGERKDLLALLRKLV
ncbi:hypothetical protein V6C53_02845 [Desulfocurvibacter africanus]|uniref:hypothetical protein n=1 Tax=Desulfocurvibacter africanus TaxID=873 RepID=UPI0004242E71|nr:hypothetical protein [Desulfocurvibacter africanus]